MLIFGQVKVGGPPLKISKTLFRDSGWPKRSTQWANFLLGLRPQTIKGARGGHAHFPAKNGQKKSKMKNNQSIDNGLLNSQKKFSQIGPEMVELWQKNVCPNMGMRTIFGHNLAK